MKWFPRALVGFATRANGIELTETALILGRLTALDELMLAHGVHGADLITAMRWTGNVTFDRILTRHASPPIRTSEDGNCS
ncbi:hypothetical protein VCHA56P521_340003 [Vibrio chagasii]|nr:hypothetical protein VCHA52P461_310003 [Vibrio chagasii]CAH7401446.1 hypothetical protein VCHA37P203_360003 [Vibrio chagasii]CAH7412130.1 hypothetical protein VCHA56P521_340003 [Vibrio chagasii]